MAQNKAERSRAPHSGAMTAIVSSLFTLSLILAVTLGAQTRPWAWGPALVVLAIAALSSIPGLLRGKHLQDSGLLFFAFIGALWTAIRAWTSPVAEFGTADLLLLGATVTSFVVARTISHESSGLRIFCWGLWALILLNGYLIIRQISDPSHNLIYPVRPGAYPSGLFGHYNDSANFLLGAGFLLLGGALSGDHGKLTRWIWSATSITNLGLIYFTHSRSGLLAAAVGGGALTILFLISTKRTGSKWFVPLLLAMPVVGIVIVLFLLRGWSAAQEIRTESTDFAQITTNVRLFLWGIALSCVKLHPWTGGGSRSFSWESLQFWDFNKHGWQQLRPEYTHNELLQAFTDYGIIGGLHLVILLIVISLLVLLRSLLGDRTKNLQLFSYGFGAAAALCAMLVQSGFNFVFHLLPGTILLGFVMGQVSNPGPSDIRVSSPINRSLRYVLALCVVIMAAGLLLFGTKGTRVMAALSPVIFRTGGTVGVEDRAYYYQKAAKIWPQSGLYKELAFAFQRFGPRNDSTQYPENPDVMAVEAYRKGLEYQPNDVSLSLNLADLLSYLGRDEEATEEYRRTIHLQGGMEMGVGGHRKLSIHLAKIGNSRLAQSDFSGAFSFFATALGEYEKTGALSPSYPTSSEGNELLERILNGLGLSAEFSGDLEGALKSYRQLADRNSTTGHYRAGMLLGKMAQTAYLERRPSDAYSMFLKATEHLQKVTTPPPGSNPAEIRERLSYFSQMIEFFAGANITPAGN